MIVVLNNNNEKIAEVLSHLRYIKKGQIINDITVLDIKHNSRNVSLRNTYYEMTEETRFYTRSESIELVGLEAQEKNAEKMIYAPLMHHKELMSYNLYSNNIFLLTGKKGMHKSNFIKKVAQNLCVNAIIYDFHEYSEVDTFKNIYTKSIKTSPCITVFKNFTTKSVEAINAINSLIQTKLDNKFGRVFVFISNGNDHGDFLKSKLNINNTIELSAPKQNDIKAIMGNLLEKIPNKINEDEMNELCELMKGKSIKEIKNLITNIVNNKIYIHMIENKAEIKTNNIERFDYTKLFMIESSLEDKLDNLYMTTSFILKFEDISKHLKRNILTHRDETLTKTNITFKDIGGYDDVKQLLVETVIWPLEHKALYNKLNMVTSKGLILHGPPGCAKTLLAKAITNESKMSFISVKGSELENKWVGETDKTIRNLFKKARDNSPCVIFIDEIDTIAQKMEKSSNEHHSKTLGAFLTEMDGLEEAKDVIVIGATNRIDIIDPAFVRPGRIDKKIYVGLPNDEARKKIFMIKLDNQELDYDLFVKMSKGFSGAEITLICHEAKMICLRGIVAGTINSHNLTNEVIVEAFEKIAKLNKKIQ